MSSVLSGVLIPMMSRAAHRNEDKFLRLLRRGLEAVCIVALPVSVFVALLGRNAFDRRSLQAIGLSLGIGALVLAMHTVLAPLGELRLVADVLAYLVLSVVLRVLRVDDLRNLVRLIRDRRLARERSSRCPPEEQGSA